MVNTKLIALVQPHSDSAVSIGRKFSAKLLDPLTKHCFVRTFVLLGLILLEQSISVGAIDAKGNRDLRDRIPLAMRDPYHILGFNLRPSSSFFGESQSGCLFRQ